MSGRRPLLALLLAAAVVLGPRWAAATDGDLAIVNARIYVAPEDPAIASGSIVVRAGRIAAIGPGAPRALGPGTTLIDARGAAVTAGFWNCHVHLMTPGVLRARERPADQLARELEAMLTRFGFTTVFDLASPLENTRALRDRVESGEVRGPRILTVGDPFFPEHGTPIYVRKYLEQIGMPSAEVSSPEAAVRRARAQLASGADGVKIFAGAIVGGEQGVLPMRLDIATAVVREAHRAGKPAFAHPSNAQGVEIALASGVDVLAHAAPMMGEWPPQLVGRLRTAHLALVPTLTLFEVEERKVGASAEVIAQMDEITVQQLRAFAAAGGPVLFGTDVGYIDVYDTSEELRLMSRALGWRQILATLTTAPARLFRLGTGRLVRGAPADLVILMNDPASDATALAHVRYTIRAGRILYQAP